MAVNEIFYGIAQSHQLNVATGYYRLVPDPILATVHVIRRCTNSRR
jgi:hypothetical protein